MLLKAWACADADGMIWGFLSGGRWWVEFWEKSTVVAEACVVGDICDLRIVCAVLLGGFWLRSQMHACVLLMLDPPQLCGHVEHTRVCVGCVWVWRRLMSLCHAGRFSGSH